jgi:hypothetical protein
MTVRRARSLAIDHPRALCHSDAKRSAGREILLSSGASAPLCFVISASAATGIRVFPLACDTVCKSRTVNRTMTKFLQQRGFTIIQYRCNGNAFPN